MPVEVRFLRLRTASDQNITECLVVWYTKGWRVVSHSESKDEYSFVLERIYQVSGGDQ
jgi:hypothetical protein